MESEPRDVRSNDVTLGANETAHNGTKIKVFLAAAEHVKPFILQGYRITRRPTVCMPLPWVPQAVDT
ncbi:hypothetical protein E2C01_040515 [Portunus trituberculatus]|uniref:Uncharacterized protein n=1 Tax=Portunus trituberculatus TaxID=210409 RepID=A0A5B7FNH2_PORTR|nr:hypothetical protein [Portunus trituberculatus]